MMRAVTDFLLSCVVYPAVVLAARIMGPY